MNRRGPRKPPRPSRRAPVPPSPPTARHDVATLEAHDVHPLLPVDDRWLERARTQWQFGDWDSLAQIDRDRLQAHPERARLALLAAAGHQQRGDADAARRLASLAIDWGCSRRLVSQVLLAGVHNTLGRAAAAIDPGGERSRRHFEAALSIAQPGQDLRLLVRARMGRQLDQLGMTEHSRPVRRLTAAAKPRPPAPAPAPVATSEQLDRALQALTERLDSMASMLAKHDALLETLANRPDPSPHGGGEGGTPAPQARQVPQNGLVGSILPLLKTQAEQIEKLRAGQGTVRRMVEDTVRHEIRNAARQTEAYVALGHYMSHGELMPGLHGWPVSPDLAMLLVEQLERVAYDAVVEFGSGASTALMAQALARIAARQPARRRPLQLAFEHLARYHTKTGEQLERAGLRAQVRLELAPLIPYRAGDGLVMPYYRCQGALQALANDLGRSEVRQPRVLVLVDGPPASTGPQARYPALPLLRQALPDATFDLLVDDYGRPDEKAIVLRWCAELEAQGVRAMLEEIPLEKEACVVSFGPVQSESQP